MISNENLIKLELIQVSGIVNMLLNKCDIDLLEIRINRIRDIETKDVKKIIKRLSRKELIQLVKMSSEINDDDVKQAYEMNRYGLRPGFTLCYFGKKCDNVENVQIEAWLRSNLDAIKYNDDEQYKKLALRSIETIAVDTIEISFSYLAKHSYLSENEVPEYVYEFKETFAWINPKDGYLAIKNAPNKIANAIKQIIGRLYGTQMSSVCLTKKMISEVFGENKLKRGTFYKPNAGDDEAQKVTISDANLSEKPSVRSAYGDYDLMSSSLEESINEDISSTLGINGKQGKIYLSKNLNASDFRAWSVKRIKDIISYMTAANLESQEAFNVKNPMDNDIWNKYTENQRKTIKKILFCIFCMKKHKLESYNLECTTTEIIDKCDKFFLKHFLCSDEGADEIGVPSCIECGSTKFIMSKNRRLTCSGCGSQQEGVYRLLGDDNEIHDFSGIEKIVSLIPNTELLQDIVVSLRELFNIEILSKETFYIYDGVLTILTGDKYGGEIKIEEIQELESIKNINCDIKQKQLLLEEFRTIKEKCKVHNNESCNKCNYGDRLCIMKLFSVFDFRPSPHQNSEFGDVNFQVTYEGKKRRLVGIAKSSCGNETLTVSTKEAREMIQQVLTMSHDGRVDIIAAICPMRFHPQLERELEYIGRLSGKKIVYFDDEFMIRLLKYYRKINNRE